MFWLKCTAFINVPMPYSFKVGANDSGTGALRGWRCDATVRHARAAGHNVIVNEFAECQTSIADPAGSIIEFNSMDFRYSTATSRPHWHS
jgi:hypothetical protein